MKSEEQGGVLQDPTPKFTWGLRWLLTAVAQTNNWLVLVSLILALSLISTGASGRHGPWVDAKVFIGDGSELYIDIPEAKNHKYAVLYDIGIAKLDDSGRFAGYFWGIIKSGYSSNADVTVLPLRYGEEIKGSITEISAMELVNGTYSIKGFIKFFDSDELEKVGTPFYATYFGGCFEYENGSVRNIHC